MHISDIAHDLRHSDRRALDAIAGAIVVEHIDRWRALYAARV